MSDMPRASFTSQRTNATPLTKNATIVRRFFHHFLDSLSASCFGNPSRLKYMFFYTFGTFYMFDSPNSELRWIFPLSELKRSSSMKLRVRYKVEIPTNNLFITFNIKVMHSSNHKINAPVTKHWILSESIEFAFRPKSLYLPFHPKVIRKTSESERY